MTVPNAAQNNGVNTIANFNPKPETTVAYDVGLDQRPHDGGAVSTDLYDDTVHDVFLSNATNIGTLPGVCGRRPRDRRRSRSRTRCACRSTAALRGAHGTLFERGGDYEGSNNSSFGPPYEIWDASVGIPVASKRVRLLFFAQNLFNINLGTALGRTLSNQGNVEPSVWLNTATGQLLPGSRTVSTANGLTNINALPPRTIRMSLDVAL